MHLGRCSLVIGPILWMEPLTDRYLFITDAAFRAPHERMNFNTPTDVIATEIQALLQIRNTRIVNN